MVKQRFLTRFRPAVVTVLKVFGPVLGYQLLELVLGHFRYLPPSILDVLMVAAAILLVIALICGAWAWGEWSWARLRRLRFFWSEVKRFSREYWSPQQGGTAKF